LKKGESLERKGARQSKRKGNKNYAQKVCANYNFIFFWFYNHQFLYFREIFLQIACHGEQYQSQR
jgi:hypothetical protein